MSYTHRNTNKFKWKSFSLWTGANRSRGMSREGQARQGMRQAAHVTHTSFTPTAAAAAAACGASPELLTFTSAWRASHVAVVILRRPLSHRVPLSRCPTVPLSCNVHRTDVWRLAVDVATFGRIKCAATPGDISSKTSVQMGDGNQRTSKFNVQLCPCSSNNNKRNDWERERESEGVEGESTSQGHRGSISISQNFASNWIMSFAWLTGRAQMQMPGSPKRGVGQSRAGRERWMVDSRWYTLAQQWI